MWLVAGLGNPGPKYARTRHNIGFCVIDAMAQQFANHDRWKQVRGGASLDGSIEGTKVLFVKPMEFMNRSGFSLQRYCAFHKVAPQKLLVIHDEIHFDFGEIRVKRSGGHGGHNGIRSVIAQLGNKDFPRIRVGVGTAPRAEPGPPLVNHVLGEFSGEESSELPTLINLTKDAAVCVVTNGLDAAMNRFSRRTAQNSD